MLSVISRQFGLKSYLLLVLLLFVVTSVLVPLVLALDPGLLPAGFSNLHLSTILQVFGIGGFAVYVLAQNKVRPYIDVKGSIRSFPIQLAYAGALFVISRLLFDGYRWIRIGATDDFANYSVVAGQSWSGLLVLCFYLAVIPAVFEEAFYRVAAHSCLSGYRSGVIVAVSTLCFAASHIPAGVGSVISAAVLGCFLMAQFVRDRNYGDLVVLHACFNVLNLVFTYRIFWVTDPIYIGSRASSGVEAIFWGLIYVAGAVLLCCILLILPSLVRFLQSKPAVGALGGQRTR